MYSIGPTFIVVNSQILDKLSSHMVTLTACSHRLAGLQNFVPFQAVPDGRSFLRFNLKYPKNQPADFSILDTQEASTMSLDTDPRLQDAIRSISTKISVLRDEIKGFEHQKANQVKFLIYQFLKHAIVQAVPFDYWFLTV